MATSTVARSMASFLSIAIFLATTGTMVTADLVPISVFPTNATSEPPESMTKVKLSGPASPDHIFDLAPLTSEVGKGQTAGAVKQVIFSGVGKNPDYMTAKDLTPSDVAFISCDPNDSNISASQVVQTASGISPKAIILYSEIANVCNFTGSTSYTSIFTMISMADVQTMITTMGLYPDSSDDLAAKVGTNATLSGSTSSSSSSSDGGAAPTTAVAMSILYSITGIITLLFLVIIATGAVRAHRHPERYGPRNGYSGRPRQSRAKGLARAMLETLPIVKFGDPAPAKPGSRDVELEEGASSVHHPPAETGPQQAEISTEQRPKSPVVAKLASATSDEGKAKDDAAKSSAVEEAAVPKEGELGCSICTEDFTTGEDVRVLPCQHKYHPACIDPWLLNVSGTCPLCRHDLRPDAAEGSNGAATTTTTAATDDLPPPLGAESPTGTSGLSAAEDATSTHQRHRMSRFLDLNRLRHAPPDERIAALRRLREESRSEGEPVIENAEEHQSGRARLTSRLRDKFRIRTRMQNATVPE
ncbi:uncharacterized protein BP5553_02836 [Venustampulla echinocandica]|uniref:RING-type domain-containing protein n=1 Tax=Venustampulla echinocandica TaxID=2656787 RepID=A0A370TSJ0_9HELO|nr:uncharacterized protein BP5553_02836 [Venustampulla echinocandica]RDL38496.1 hypothetical protein BP5553_02836 [Venustampulla echinocandica]